MEVLLIGLYNSIYSQLGFIWVTEVQRLMQDSMDSMELVAHPPTHPSDILQFSLREPMEEGNDRDTSEYHLTVMHTCACTHTHTQFFSSHTPKCTDFLFISSLAQCHLKHQGVKTGFSLRMNINACYVSKVPSFVCLFLCLCVCVCMCPLK